MKIMAFHKKSFVKIPMRKNMAKKTLLYFILTFI